MLHSWTLNPKSGALCHHTLFEHAWNGKWEWTRNCVQVTEQYPTLNRHNKN